VMVRVLVVKFILKPRFLLVAIIVIPFLVQIVGGD